MGTSRKKNSAITEKDRKLTAVHEAGHAVVSAKVRPNVKNFEISIIPRGNAGGNDKSDPNRHCPCIFSIHTGSFPSRPT